MISEIICIGLGFGAGVTVAVLHQVKVFNKLHSEIDRLRKQVASRDLLGIMSPVLAEMGKEVVRSFFPPKIMKTEVDKSKDPGKKK